MCEFWPGSLWDWRCRRPPGAFGGSEEQEVLVLAEGAPSASLWGLTGGTCLAGARLRQVQGDPRDTLSCRRVWPGGSSVGVRMLRRELSFILSRLEPDWSPDCGGGAWESRWDQSVPPGTGGGSSEHGDGRREWTAGPGPTLQILCLPGPHLCSSLLESEPRMTSPSCHSPRGDPASTSGTK